MMSFDWKYYRGDIYYADLNPVCGCEQGGKRPVVIQNDTENLFSTTLIVAMVTTKQFKKHKYPTHYLIKNNNAFTEPSVILLEQIRTIDKKRISKYLGKITEKDMRGIDQALLVSLALNTYSEHT